jgi:hypothetical protein
VERLGDRIKNESFCFFFQKEALACLSLNAVTASLKQAVLF